MLNKKSLFSIVGVGLILALVFVVLQTYVKRGVQGRLKSASDDIGMQYEPYYRDASSFIKSAPQQVNFQNKTIRKIIRNVNLNLKVKDAEQGQVNITAIVLKFNGIIINSNINKSSDGSRNGSMVFKVLPKDLENALSEIKKLGEVQSEGQTGEDVTEQYVDLQARLQNYKLVKDRLVKILEEKAREVKDILEVEKEMARVGAEIESLEGKIKFIDQQTDMATVTIYYYEKRSHVFRGINIGEKFQETLHVSAETLVNTFNGIIVVFAFLIPVCFWGFLGWGVWNILRRIVKK